MKHVKKAIEVKNNVPEVSPARIIEVPDFTGCQSDLDFIQAFLRVANENQTKLILNNIERIFLYGA